MEIGVTITEKPDKARPKETDPLVPEREALDKCLSDLLGKPSDETLIGYYRQKALLFNKMADINGDGHLAEVFRTVAFESDKLIGYIEDPVKDPIAEIMFRQRVFGGLVTELKNENKKSGREKYDVGELENYLGRRVQDFISEEASE